MTTDSASSAPSLHLETSGAGAPVVLLHSSGLSGRQWRRLVSGLLQRGFRAIAVDLGGHGAAPAVTEPTPFSFRTDLASVVALLEAGPPAHVVAHSYGALIGLLSALSAPSAVRSLTLFEPVAFGVLDATADADAIASLTAADFRWGSEAADRERWLQTFVDYWGGTGAWAALREEARAEFRRVGWVVREGVKSLMADRTPASAYSALRCPVQLITAEGSPLAARRVVQRLGEAIPGARVTMLPNAGHMAPLSHADLVNDVIFKALGPA